MDNRLSWNELGNRPLLFPAAFFGFGGWIGAQLGAPAALFLLWAACLLGISLLFSARTGAHLLLLVACAAAGAGLSTLAARAEVPGALSDGGAALVEGEVSDVLRLPDTTRLEVKASRVDGEPSRARLRVYLRGRPLTLFPGQRVQFAARLKPLTPVANPGEPDFQEAQERRGLLLTGGAAPERVVVLTPPSAYQRWLRRTHEELAARVRAWAPSPEAAALYLTLAAGMRAELGDGLEDTFSRSGLAHVLSVSGLHVAVLAVVVLWLLRALLSRTWRAARRLDVRRVAAPLAIPLVWAYVVFTGNQMPAVRSAVMATAVLFAMALWRRADALNALALAALAVLAFDPAAVADLSTRLSFLAVLSLLIVAPALRAAIPLERPEPGRGPYWRYRLHRMGEAALGTFCASLAVTVTSAPLIAEAFQRLSLAGLFSNIVTLPLCGALTLAAAGGAFAFIAHPVAAVPFIVAGTWGSELLLHLAAWFSRMPGASVPVHAFGPWATTAYLVAVFGWALLRGRWRWPVGALAPVAILWAFVVPAVWPAPGMTVTFLSVGQGDAIVVESGGHALLVDGGGVPGGADTADRFVLPFLRHRGIRALDLAVLSHPHPDHALGLITVLEKLPVKRLWVPAGDEGGELGLRVVAAAGDAQVEEVEAGHAPFALGEATVEVLGPPRDRVLLEGVNDRSVVLRVRHGEVTVLLAGDIEGAAEELLDPGAVTVLKVPHHGSSTSSSEAFVRRVRPKVAVFCVGAHNRFGFPDEDVEARYLEAGAACYRTDLHGAISVHSDGRTVQVETFLQPAERAPPVPVAAAPQGAQP